MIFFLLLLPREQTLKLEERKHNHFTTPWCFHISLRPPPGRWGHFFQETSQSLLKGHFQPLFLCTGRKSQEEQYIWIISPSLGSGGDRFQSREGQTRWRQRLSPTEDCGAPTPSFCGNWSWESFLTLARDLKHVPSLNCYKSVQDSWSKIPRPSWYSCVGDLA